MTKKDHQTFRELYDTLPQKTAVAPKSEFINRIAKITCKSTKTVYCWLAGVQVPDALAQSVIEKELKVPASVLFPKKD